MRTAPLAVILFPVRWIVVLGLVACSGPSPVPRDAGADHAIEGMDASVAASLDLEVLTVQGGAPVTGELRDDRHRIERLRVGLARLEWKTDVREELYVEQGVAVDLLRATTIAAMELPPGRYSEVELELAEGPWGPALAADVDGELVDVTEPFALHARCDGPLELGVGDEIDVTLEVDGDRLLERLDASEEADGPADALRQALDGSLRLSCQR